MKKDIYEDCFNIYCKLNEALQKGNIDRVAEFISPDVYNEYKEKEKYYKDKNIEYVFSPSAKLKSAKDNNNVVTLLITTQDTNDNIISESHVPKTITVEIGYLKDTKHFMCRCKKCNKYYKDIIVNKCEKCGSMLAKENYSIVITSIK